ncbi:MAG: polyprenyl synthetase family protein [Anaerolineae bacterium]|nr:polyprenyl synthetase family protein [Gemmatimonadaceae bacterium]
MSSPRVRSVTPSLGEIQAPVHDHLDQVAQELRRIVVADFPMIEQISGHLLLMKGKLFRPTLTLLASSVEGRDAPRAVTLGAIVELIHLATLVHDDSVDHSALRRGMPTVNSLFSHQVSVIMGDFLYSRAVAELARLGDIEVLRTLAAATTEMTVGEMRQLGAVDALQFSEADYETLIRSKTASLLSAACEIGGIAGAPRFRKALSLYGRCLGMAFQVADDLLDYTASEAEMGKPGGSDLREHKVTLPLIAALRKMGTAERAEVEALFANPSPEDAQVRRVAEIVVELGGLDYARNRGEQFADEANAALSDLPETSASTALRDAIVYAVDRSQ